MKFHDTCDCFSLPPECRMFVPEDLPNEAAVRARIQQLTDAGVRYAALHVRGKHVITYPVGRGSFGDPARWVLST